MARGGRLSAHECVAAARGKRPKRIAPVILSLALLVTGGAWSRALGPVPLHGLIVTMINVGQGDAILVRQGSHTMLIDGGPDPAKMASPLGGAVADGLLAQYAVAHEDAVVRVPAVSIVSFSPIGIPCSGPRRLPAVCSFSRTFA